MPPGYYFLLLNPNSPAFLRRLLCRGNVNVSNEVNNSTFPPPASMPQFVLLAANVADQS